MKFEDNGYFLNIPYVSLGDIREWLNTRIVFKKSFFFARKKANSDSLFKCVYLNNLYINCSVYITQQVS